MKKYIIMNDLHREGVHQIHGSEAELYFDLARKQKEHGITDEDTYPAGDNHDFSGVKKDNVDELRIEAAMFFGRFQKNYIAGNHERGVLGNNPEFRVILGQFGEKYLLTHGDITFWGLQKAYDYRNENKIGAGSLKRSMQMAFDKLRHLIKPKLKADYIKRAELYMKQFGCIGIIQGHKHPVEKIDTIINGFRHIVLPRGINVVEL